MVRARARARARVRVDDVAPDLKYKVMPLRRASAEHALHATSQQVHHEHVARPAEDLVRVRARVRARVRGRVRVRVRARSARPGRRPLALTLYLDDRLPRVVMEYDAAPLA